MGIAEIGRDPEHAEAQDVEDARARDADREGSARRATRRPRPAHDGDAQQQPKSGAIEDGRLERIVQRQERHESGIARNRRLVQGA
jgi:hypothetical protein